MAKFVPHTPETANAEGRENLEGVKQKYGFVPNLTGTPVHAPKLAKGYLALAPMQHLPTDVVESIRNFTNHIASTELDAAFAEFAWQKPEANAA
jgi:hypothetical protein